VTDDEAKAKIEAIRKRIVDGKEDFAKVAKAESDDKHSGEEGGELGTFGHGMMVPQFEQAAFALKAGEISQPVKTQFGYHLIQVEEKKTQPFDEVKDELKQKLGPEKVEQLVTDLKKQNKVELNEKYFGPPQPAGAAGFPGAGAPPQQ
jgi:parvulin-like peptidyl-prolyl isomerase